MHRSSVIRHSCRVGRVVTTIVVLLGDIDNTLAVSLAIFCPPAGYVFGAISAELGDNSLQISPQRPDSLLNSITSYRASTSNSADS